MAGVIEWGRDSQFFKCGGVNGSEEVFQTGEYRHCHKIHHEGQIIKVFLEVTSSDLS